MYILQIGNTKYKRMTNPHHNDSCEGCAFEYQGICPTKPNGMYCQEYNSDNSCTNYIFKVTQSKQLPNLILESTNYL